MNQVDKKYIYFKILKSNITQEYLFWSLNTNIYTTKISEPFGNPVDCWAILKFNMTDVPLDITNDSNAIKMTMGELEIEFKNSIWGEE